MILIFVRLLQLNSNSTSTQLQTLLQLSFKLSFKLKWFHWQSKYHSYICERIIIVLNTKTQSSYYFLLFLVFSSFRLHLIFFRISLNWCFSSFHPPPYGLSFVDNLFSQFHFISVMFLCYFQMKWNEMK